MFEKVNPSHPDKIADRIAGHIVDMAYAKQENPKVAVEVLIGHKECKIIVEADDITCKEIENNTESLHKYINDISGRYCDLSMTIAPQDTHLADNQKEQIRCGDNGIFKGTPITIEQQFLTDIVRDMYNTYKTDGKYLLADYSVDYKDKKMLIACQSHAGNELLDKIRDHIKARGEFVEWIKCNPLGEWTGGIDVDTGATNRKLGSDMGDAITGGGLCGKDLSKADVSVNIWCFIMAQITGYVVSAFCSIGTTDVQVRICGSDKQIPYSQIVALARDYVFNVVGGFEKLAEWGLIR